MVFSQKSSKKQIFYGQADCKGRLLTKFDEKITTKTYSLSKNKTFGLKKAKFWETVSNFSQLLAFHKFLILQPI